MTAEAVPPVLQALSTLYSPSASSAERKQADKYLDQVRDLPDAPILGCQLAHAGSQHPTFVRHFGLGLIESTIKYKWQTPAYTDAERLAIRASVLQLCDSSASRDPPEEPMVLEKLSKIFVELAKRTWPLDWTDMDVCLRLLYGQSLAGRKLVLLIYKSLAEDVFLFEDAVAVSRKKELSTALVSVTVSTPLLNEILSRPVVESETQAMSARSDLKLLLQLVRANPENEGWIQRWSADLVALASQPVQSAELLLVATLDCIAICLGWIPLASIKESAVLERVVELCGAPSVAARLSAAECLLVLFTRNIPPTDPERTTVLWEPIFETGALEQLASAWFALHSRLSPGGTASLDLESLQQQIMLPEREYAFAKRFAHASRCLAPILKRVCTTTPPRFDFYIQVVLSLLNHPSLIISSHAVSFFFEAFKHDYFKDAPMRPFLARILDGLFAKLLIKQQLAQKQSCASQYAVSDFDSATEIDLASSSLMQRALEVVRLIVPLQPMLVFRWMEKKCGQVLAAPESVPGECHAVAISADAVLASIPPEAVRGQEPSQRELATALMGLLVSLIEFDGNRNPAVVVDQLQMIVAFSSYMDLYPDILFKCLEKFFSFAVFTLPSEQDFIKTGISISDQTRNLRRKAASSLGRIGTAMPNLLFPLLGQIMPVIERLVTTQQILRIEQTLLVEFLVAIICGADAPPAEKHALLEAVLASELRQFKSFEPFTASFDAFLEASGILSLARHDAVVKAAGKQELPADLAQRLSSASERRAAWSANFNAIWVYLRRAKHSRSAAASAAPPSVPPEIISFVLPQLLATVKCMHSLWTPQVLAQLPKDFESIMRLTRSERLALLGGQLLGNDGEEAASSAENAFDRQLDSICGWLTRMREICYQTISVFSSLGSEFYNIPDLAAHLISTLLILLPILPTFCQNAIHRLSALWRTHPAASAPQDGTAAEDRGGVDGDHDNDNDDNEDVSDEIIADKLLRGLTRAYAELWGAILTPFADKNPKRRGKADADAPAEAEPKLTFQHQDLVAFVFSNEVPLAQCFFATVSLLMSVRDTVSCKRGITMCQTLVPLLAKNPAFHGIVGRDFLVLALEATKSDAGRGEQILHEGYQKSNHNEAVALITDIYVQVRGASQIPFDTMASIPGMTADALTAFETQLAAKTTIKERHLVVRNMLQAVTGVEVSERFKKTTAFVLNMSEKRIFLDARRDLHHADIVDKETIAPVLSSFFDAHE
ncbi:karyopherin [Polyrhizophydium stewartii]|uniref:Karyopherin n=1 Tax=Polyrhizophydium stewartii TaxID=2732419 RepID=A0ABR4NKJ6_9FUNG